ncbi:hypothetical protein, partial [Pseudomonas aeruginosa]
LFLDARVGQQPVQPVDAGGEGVTFIIEQLRRLLEENGVRVRVGGEPAQPGEVVLLDAPALLDSREAFIALRRAD